MKLLPFILLLFSSWQFSARSFHFPDVEYEYAKIYYFNLGEITTRPDDYIYTKENGFAKSIEGEGILSSNALPANIEKLFLYKKDGLLNGLSGCYIPRHGVVYFDKNDNPVASLSICFECEAIRMWTKDKGKIKSSNPKATEGASQLHTLKMFLKKEGIEVYENPKDYSKMNQNTKATITINMDLVDTNITQVTYTEAIKWFQSAPKTSIDSEYTAGGKKYDFAVLETGPNTRFIFQSSRTNAKLGEATIESNLVVLPNGIRIGSSLEEVMNTLLVYDGPSNPSIITLQDSTYKIVYTFENEKVVSITINK